MPGVSVANFPCGHERTRDRVVSPRDPSEMSDANWRYQFELRWTRDWGLSAVRPAVDWGVRGRGPDRAAHRHRNWDNRGVNAGLRIPSGQLRRDMGQCDVLVASCQRTTLELQKKRGPSLGFFGDRVLLFQMPMTGGSSSWSHWCDSSAHWSEQARRRRARAANRRPRTH